MTTTGIRFTLTVPDDLAKKAAQLKKENYYDKPYAEMYRQLIQLGMDTLEAEKLKTDATTDTRREAV